MHRLIDGAGAEHLAERVEGPVVIHDLAVRILLTEMLESGEYATLAELADAERISRSYVCRVMRRMLLAPDIIERILDGRPTAGLEPFLKPFPV